MTPRLNFNQARRMMVLLLLAATAASCSREGSTLLLPDAADAPDRSPLVTVVYDPDALGDRSYNDLIYQGVEAAAFRYGLRTMQLSPSTKAEGLAYLETIFSQMAEMRDTVRRLFIVISPSYDDWLRRNNRRLEANPYADLLYLETSTPLAGKGSTLFLSYYGAMYEAGAIAPRFATSALVVGANPKNEQVDDAIRGVCDGFTSGVLPQELSREEDLTVSVDYLADSIDEGYGIADTTALKFLETRYQPRRQQLLVPVCGGSASTLHRINEVLRYYVMMGVDAPIVSTMSPFSAVKHIDRAVGLCIGQWLSAEGMPKHQHLGLADGYTGVEIHIVESIFNGLLFDELTDDMLKKAHAEAVRKEAEREG